MNAARGGFAGLLLVGIGAIAALLERRWKPCRLGCSYVFHTKGEPITEYRFRSRFAGALTAARLEKKLPHDMRRAMSRDQIRAAVSKPVAMKNTGHRDARVFDRYDITATEDQAGRLAGDRSLPGQGGEVGQSFRQPKRKCLICCPK